MEFEEDELELPGSGLASGTSGLAEGCAKLPSWITVVERTKVKGVWIS